jgi:hypothetical protein
VTSRTFIVILVAAAGAAWPLAIRAQQQPVPIVGSLHSASAGYIRSVGGFGESPEQTGFIDGKNVTIEYRRADGHTERLPARADFVQPTKFEMVINLKTAKALGLAIPPTLLATAGEVIE